ncbi:MAG: hypothetical protein A2V72_02400 [Candidatus Nealsonbacteria bacterium RBG_13_37_56]|uniref:Membrane protein 6-pyruvoyl-tetrahydropterin synthase-related domain-containing protein n=1 Tax=Candidatus Nealsonbacteria bacterium RBG_13_37_56 TaxID=1801661 RepID=A0A1G2DW60_9BACT|nr:MAG: hypothetical protein A2V72_02400 [Candidatus Nealsonbacteria bacterium RBG_13_37_56]HJX45590.1 hypothetical protein [Patescibacteria group bacterium]
MMGKIKQKAGLVVGLILVLLTTFLTAQKLSLISGFPKGVDAYAHLTRIVWILTRFPQINWNPSWDSGTFFWLWSYPPTGSILSALLVKIFGISVEASLTWVAFACMLIFALGLFATLSLWTGTWISIPITLLALTTPALWSWWGHGGNYIRIWGMAFYSLSLAIFVYYLKKPSRWVYIFLIIFLGLSLTTHMLFTALTVATIGGYTLFSVPGFKEKIIILVKTLGLGLLLASFWYVPMIFSTTGERFLEQSLGGPVKFSSLFSILPQEPFFSLPLYFTVFMVATFAAGVILIFFKHKLNSRLWAVMSTFTIGLLGAFAYAFGRNFDWFPRSFSASGFAPFAAFPFIIIFSCLLAGGITGAVFNRFKYSLIIVFLSLGFSFGIIFILLNRNYSKYIIYNMTEKNQIQTYAIDPVKALPLDEKYRFGTDSAFVSDWFNFLYPNLSQTRDYIYQGIPYKNWQFFQEYTLWTQEGGYPEAQWLLDWYGVRYFTVGFASGNTKFDKFFSRPDLFEQIYADQKQNYYLFEYKNAKPILVASNATPVLVFGQDKDYEVFVRSLALGGLGSDTVIPVYGGENINKFDRSKLSFFPDIFLYHYKPTDSLAEKDLILDYVVNGGIVYIEAGPETQLLSWPAWSPVAQGQIIEIKDNWNFTFISEELGINEQEFSPPIYGNDPWKLLKGKVLDSLDVEILIKVLDQPVVVKKQFQKGYVTWSSMNLPYHAESFRNQKEVLLLTKLLNISTLPEKIGNVNLIKNKPEERIWEINGPGKGIVWKESWFPRWKITWTDSKGKRGISPHYLAGPSLSYIPLPQDATYPIRVNAIYHLNFFDYLGWIITVLVFIYLLFYIKGGEIFSNIFGGLSTRFSKKVKGWWEKDEDELQ